MEYNKNLIQAPFRCFRTFDQLLITWLCHHWQYLLALRESQYNLRVVIGLPMNPKDSWIKMLGSMSIKYYILIMHDTLCLLHPSMGFSFWVSSLTNLHLTNVYIHRRRLLEMRSTLSIRVIITSRNPSLWHSNRRLTSLRSVGLKNGNFLLKWL